MRRHSYILLAVLLALSSCTTTKQLALLEQQQTQLSQQLDSMNQQLGAMQQQLNQLSRLMGELTGAQTATTGQTTRTTTEKRDWNTCTMRNAKAKVTLGGKTYSSACSTQAIWDSLVVISITPVFGIEVFRIEATPHDVTVINKNDKEYYRATYAEINAVVRPFLTYADLRSVASGKTPASAKNGVLTYTAKQGSASLEMTYTTPTLNKPLTIQRADLKRYTKKDIRNLLK